MPSHGKIHLVRGEHGSLNQATGEANVFLIRLVRHGELMGQNDDQLHQGHTPLVEIFHTDTKNPMMGNGELVATFTAPQVSRLEFDLPLVFERDDVELKIPTPSVFDMQRWVNSKVNLHRLDVDHDESFFPQSRGIWINLANAIGLDPGLDNPSFKDDFALKATALILDLKSQLNSAAN